jgi:membrane protease YdiL (CAAX protease family)
MASTQHQNITNQHEERLLDAALYALVAYSLFFLLVSKFEITALKISGLPQLFFLLASVVVIGRSKLPLKFFGLHSGKLVKEIGVGLAIAVVPVSVALIAACLAGVEFSGWQGFVQKSLAGKELKHLFVLVVLAPVTEELFFRGVLTRAMMKRLRPVWVVLAVSAIFMVAHFALKVGPFVLGLAATSLFIWRRSIIPCIVLHSICNALGPLLLYFAPNAFDKLRIFFL